MPWAALIPIIAQYGLPLAELLIKKVSTGQNATPQDFVDLNALAGNTPQSHLAAVAQHLGLPMTDPKITALLALIS